MGSRNDARRTVVGGEIVEHPDGVADPIAALVGDGPHVDVERLAGVGLRIGGPGVEAAQLDVRSQHVANAAENVRRHDGAAKHVTLVDQIGKPAGVFLGLEFSAGGLSLLVEQAQNPPAQFLEEVTGVIPSSRTTQPCSSSRRH